MIKILEKSVADKIAAGEVIDRPVSIIKELVENSLDAGASSITVEIRGGGKSYIRVTDNGCGIDADEAELAFKRHATSKITSACDLDAIATLGFRGEALASICAVARVELITKTADAKTGRKLVIEGSETLENTAIGCPEGTTVTVRDLFYNVPARYKFLASENSETRRIIDMVSRIALAYGDVKFSLINGTANVFTTHGKGNIFNSIISIYGTDIGKDLLPVQRSRDGFIVKGFVSSPAESLPSRSRQIFCVNGRVIASKVMERALDEAYKEKLFHGRFPIAFLFLAMPPEKLDVNIHPTKKEIRFDDNFEVEDFIKKAVIKALTQKDALPKVRAEDIKDVGKKISFDAEDKEENYDYNDGNSTDNRANIQMEEVNSAAEINAGEINTIGKSSNIREKFRVESQTFSGDNQQVDIKKLLSTMRQNKENIDKTEEDIVKSGRHGEHRFDFTELNYIGAIFNTYIMATDDDSFYMIDQHAAHERIFYEKLKAQYNSAQKSSQQLLIPLNFNVAAHVAAGEEGWIDELKNMGYDIEFFGNNTYIVREIPAFMDMHEAEEFLSDIFNSLEDKPDLSNRSILDKIIMKSCKSAVKGGDSLKDEEISALIKDLSNCTNPFSCPHGRPTFVRISKYEIERMFKRV